MYIVNIEERLDDCYKCGALINKVYWSSMSNDFLKLYKEYTNKPYPVFSEIDIFNVITEKPIEEIIEELEINLKNILKYKNDKRIIKYKSNINFIIRGLTTKEIVLHKVNYNNIDKNFMNGESVFKKNSIDIDRIISSTLIRRGSGRSRYEDIIWYYLNGN